VIITAQDWGINRVLQYLCTGRRKKMSLPQCTDCRTRNTCRKWCRN